MTAYSYDCFHTSQERLIRDDIESRGRCSHVALRYREKHDQPTLRDIYEKTNQASI